MALESVFVLDFCVGIFLSSGEKFGLEHKTMAKIAKMVQLMPCVPNSKYFKAIPLGIY